MSKFEQAIKTYKESLEKKLKRKDVDEDLLRAIAKACGPSIYKADASKVACSDKSERKKIKKNFLIKKLDLKDGPDLDEAIAAVCKEMGSSNRNKYRVVFYYLLVERFNKQSVFVTVKQKEKTKSKSKSTTSKTYTMESKSPKEIIHDYAFYAACGGFIPIPLIDLTAISVIQFKMIRKLSEQYSHVSFSESKAKSLIASITGGFTAFELGIFARFLFKGVPFFGPLVGGTAMSGFAYFSTKIVGEIFDEHFASGGDLTVEELTEQRMRKIFRMEMEKGKA